MTSPMQQEALFEYHLYTLNRPTTLKNQQSKQVALLSADNVPIRKEYRLQNDASFYSGEVPEKGLKQKVDVFIEIDNKEENHLGIPLPKGITRVYKNDNDGRPQFIGEDRIDHTAKNDTIRLKLGSAFDVNGTRKILESKDISSKIDKVTNTAIYENTYSIELTNAKKEAVTVKIVEPIPGDWTILEESSKHEKVGAYLAQWNISVPAEGKAELKYKVRMKF